MRIEIDVSKIEELAKRYGIAAKDLRAGNRLAMRESLGTIQRIARAEHRFKTRTGMAEKEIEVDDEIKETANFIEGAVYLKEELAPYSRWLHEGSRRHWVEPKDKKALRWAVPGGFGFSKGHFVSGIEADPFLHNAGGKVDVLEIFSRHEREAFKRAGIDVDG